jgi:hypothetical protein
MKAFLRLTVLLSYIAFSQPVHAKELVSSFDMMQSDAFSRYSSGNEFIAGQEPGTVMMRVNLWGAVKKPGIHHIPVKTDLISLMSYAGGPNDNAIMDEIVIKRQQGKKQTRLTVDLTQVIHGEQTADLTLQPEDVIVVEAKKPWVSQDAMTFAIIASTIASTILTAVLIDRTH